MSQDRPDSPTPLAEISQGPGAFEEFLDRNQKNLVLAGIVIVLGTASYIVYDGVRTSAETSAGGALSLAEDLPALQAVVEGHPETRAARTAKVLLADRQWEEGQKDGAVETLRRFVESGAGHPALGTAKASLGSKLMALGKTGEAAEVFGDLADDPLERHVAPFALISLGDMARAAGDLDKAETHYSRLTTDFPASSFSQTANMRIASLRAKAPTEVDPPPAPETDDEAGTPPADEPFSIVPSQLPPGFSITPVDPDAPATDLDPLPEPEPEPEPEPDLEPQPEPEPEPEPAPADEIETPASAEETEAGASDEPVAPPEEESPADESDTDSSGS